jgi:hypothetical protein
VRIDIRTGVESESLSRRRGVGLGRRKMCEGDGLYEIENLRSDNSKAFSWVKPSDLILRIETDACVPARMDVPFPIE